MVRADYIARRKTRENMKNTCTSSKRMPQIIRYKFPLYLMYWSYIIVDECSIITNMDAAVTKAVCALNGSRRVGCSGTPIQNDYHNLHALSVFLQLEPWKDKEFFRKVGALHTWLSQGTNTITELHVRED